MPMPCAPGGKTAAMVLQTSSTTTSCFAREEIFRVCNAVILPFWTSPARTFVPPRSTPTNKVFFAARITHCFRFSHPKSSFWTFTTQRKNQRSDKIFDSQRDPVRVKFGANHQKVIGAWRGSNRSEE